MKKTQQNAKENCKTVKPVIWYMLKYKARPVIQTTTLYMFIYKFRKTVFCKADTMQ